MSQGNIVQDMQNIIFNEDLYGLKEAKGNSRKKMDRRYKQE